MKKVLIHILVLTAVLLTLSACGGNAEDFASAPFGSNDYQGMTLDDVLSQR